MSSSNGFHEFDWAHPSLLSQCKSLTELWIYFLKSTLSFPPTAANTAVMEAAAAIKLHSWNHIWMLCIPWHSTNIAVLLRQQLTACGWGRGTLEDVAEINTVQWRIGTAKTTGYFCRLVGNPLQYGYNNQHCLM